MNIETMPAPLEVPSPGPEAKPREEAPAATSSRSWYFAFFFVSGFCSILYELIWLRLAMAQFGVTTALVSIVLSSFMAGLGIGSWAAGRTGAQVRAASHLSAVTSLRHGRVGNWRFRRSRARWNCWLAGSCWNTWAIACPCRHRATTLPPASGWPAVWFHGVPAWAPPFLSACLPSVVISALSRDAHSAFFISRMFSALWRGR